MQWNPQSYPQLHCAALAQVNTHLQTFMSRKAPVAEEPIQEHILKAVEMSRDESKTTIKYPKDVRGSVLMCAAQLQPPFCTLPPLPVRCTNYAYAH